MHSHVLLDHVLVVALTTVLPIHGAWAYSRLVRRVRGGVPDARVREYRSTMVAQWIITGGVLLFWWQVSRAADTLGFQIAGGLRLWLGAGVTAAGVALLLAQWRAAMTMSEEEIARLRKQMDSVVEFLPHSRREAAWFRGLSVTAGVCEEIVYRGYLIWYLTSWTGPWAAALLGAVAFGAIHIYQGAAGALKTGFVGLAMGLLYVGTGSLLWPIVLHTAIDLAGGGMGRRVLGGAPPSRGGVEEVHVPGSALRRS